MRQSVAIKLQDLADRFGLKLQGDPNAVISGLASLEKARTTDLAFLTNRSYRKYLATTHAGAILLSEEDASFCKINCLISSNPRLALAKIAEIFVQKQGNEIDIHSTVVVGADTHIASTASIAPYVVIGSNCMIGDDVVIGAGSIIGDGVSIGANTVLKARVTLYDKVQVGENCLLHSGVVIGSDGFGYAYDEGKWLKMPHLGSVWIGEGVEIGANTTIDRGFLEDTTIGDGVIIDNLVQVGHNVSIGSRTAIAGCVAIAGSTSIGESCLIGGGACIAGHLEISDGISITATTGVNHSIREPGIYSAGLPAKPNHIWRKNAARFQYLDDMGRRLRALENMVRANDALKSEG